MQTVNPMSNEEQNAIDYLEHVWKLSNPESPPKSSSSTWGSDIIMALIITLAVSLINIISMVIPIPLFAKVAVIFATCLYLVHVRNPKLGSKGRHVQFA